jgi:limonene-1,2-epoxide hydrolase
MAATDVVTEYMQALQAGEWDRLAATLAEEGLVRDGPFVDVIHGRDAYVEFLRRVTSPFQNYELRVSRLGVSAEGRVYAELHECMDREGGRAEFPEVIVFDVDGGDKISYVSVFMKRPGGQPSIAGGRAT